MIAAPACSMLCVSDLAAAEGLTVVAEAGFDSVDVVIIPGFVDPIGLHSQSSTGSASFVAALAASGLGVSALVTYLWLPDAIDDCRELERRRAVTEELISMLNPRCWVVDGGSPLGAPSRTDAVARWRRGIDEQTVIAERHRVPLAVEGPHRGTLAESEADAAAMLRLVDPRVGHALDTFHLLRVGDDPADAIADAGERLYHLAFGAPGLAVASPIDPTAAFVGPTIESLGQLHGRANVAVAIEHAPPLPHVDRATRVAQLRRARQTLLDPGRSSS